jgi:hypothetical protein
MSGWTLGLATVLGLALATGWTEAGLAASYEAGPVRDGGGITGVVRFSGTVPPPKRFELRRAPDRGYCGALSDGSGARTLREVAVDAHGGLKDVVVTVEGVERGKPFELRETRLEANVCQFLPFVSVLRDRAPLTVMNLDPVAHDLQVYERDRDHVVIMFHRPSLTGSGTTGLIRMTGARREMVMQCGMHPYMRAHGLAVDNPYYAVSARDGSFAIADLPAGTYRVRAWHPVLGVQEREVTVRAGEATEVPWTFGAP